MKHQPIHTKFHKMSGAKYILNIQGHPASDVQFHEHIYLGLVNETMGLMASLPRYVIYEDLIDMLQDSEGSMQKSLSTMIGANLAHLPFKQVLVEFDEQAEITNSSGIVNIQKIRHFVWLSERDQTDGRFTAVPWTYIETPDQNLIALSPIIATCDLMTPDMMKKIQQEQEVSVVGPLDNGVITHCGAMFRAVPSHFLIDPKHSQIEKWMGSKCIDYAMAPAVKALCALVVLLRTRGISQERVEVNPRFNKSRAQSGKPPIQDHTVIRIGHTYDRAGNQITYSPRDKRGVYWVPGHIRNQRFGPKLSRSYELFIEPYLCNYVEGDEVPTPKTKEVTI